MMLSKTFLYYVSSVWSKSSMLSLSFKSETPSEMNLQLGTLRELQRLCEQLVENADACQLD